MTDAKRLLAEATPLPWRWVIDSGMLMLHNEQPVGGTGFVLAPHCCPECEKRGTPCLAPNDADAALIVYAVNHLPDYLAAVEALERISDMVPDAPEYELPKHENCAECRRWKDHPVQRGICDERYRQLARRDRSFEDARRKQEWRMRDLARAALDRLRDEVPV